MTTTGEGKVSVPTDTVSEDDELEALVEQDRKASAPSLATLFQRGKDSGLIKPGKEYGSA